MATTAEPARTPDQPTAASGSDGPADEAGPVGRTGHGATELSSVEPVPATGMQGSMAQAASGRAPGPSNGPASSRRWVKRAEGDRRAMARLQLIGCDGVIVLNDRRIPGSKSSIKYIAISAAGVFVIDTKGYKGLVHIKRPGPIKDLGPMELHVGRKNCTSSVEDLSGQVEIVREALSSAPWGSEVPVRALLCLTRAEWGFASPIEISDVWVGWPRLVAGRVQEPAVMDSPTVHEVSEMIASRLI
jgi:hypothetical protein